MSGALDYRTVKRVARIHNPRRNFELADIESEVRYDPLTGDSARICHFAFPKREVPDLSALVESTRSNCPFCPGAVERVTPRYPDVLVQGGRMKRGEAVLAPNLFPYDDVSPILVMSRAHFLPMQGVPAPIIADALKLAREFIALAAPTLGNRPAYGIVTWNYMPPSCAGCWQNADGRGCGPSTSNPVRLPGRRNVAGLDMIFLCGAGRRRAGRDTS